MTNTEEFTNAQSLTGEILDQIAAPCENGDFELSGGTAHVGPHIDAVDKRKVIAVYPAADMRQVATLARVQGVCPSDIHRITLSQYLEHKLSVV